MGQASPKRAKLAGTSLEQTTPVVVPTHVTPTLDTDRALTTPLPTEEESRLRKLQLDNDKLQLENEKLRFENQKVRNDVWRVRIEIGLRVLMALALFWVVIHYIYAVLDLTARQTGAEKLSDTVLGVLLGTTSVNVIGLLLAVARYLFPATGKPAVPEG